jgi:hypothetical protein
MKKTRGRDKARWAVSRGRCDLRVPVLFSVFYFMAQVALQIRYTYTHVLNTSINSNLVVSLKFAR